MPESKYFDINRLRSYLDPQAVKPSPVSDPNKQLQPATINQILETTCWNPTGSAMSFEAIKKKIDEFFTKPRQQGGSPPPKPDKKHYYMISKNSIVDSFDNKDYWSTANGEVTSLQNVITTLTTDTGKSMEVAAFATRDSYASPATRGVHIVDFFLNSMPPHIASQLSPYLSVEFRISNPAKPAGQSEYLYTPSMHRFLLGSMPQDAVTSVKGDAALYLGRHRKTTTNGGEKVTFASGMELFLAPQSLYNYDFVDPDGRHRVAPPKPFLPFASIESFDVQVGNAGAGKFASRRGTLKLRIHDKSRLAEFSEIVRGSRGWKTVEIFTEYGWSAPRADQRDNDEYFDFINQNMIRQDVWNIINSQYTFDQTGQVLFTISVATKAKQETGQFTINSNSEYFKALSELQAAIETISDMKEKYIDSGGVMIPTLAEQILNAGATTGQLSNLISKDENAFRSSLKLITASLQNAGATADELNKFKEQFKVLDPGKKSSFENVSSLANTEAQKVFEKLAGSPDPFLPDEKRASYFNKPLLEALKKYSETSAERAKILTSKDSKGNKKSILFEKSMEVVSFGKLFLNMVVPAYAKEIRPLNIDEVQVFFYKLNNYCGPISGHSIAEFPINMTALAYAYTAAIKEANMPALTVETFMQLVIETQFADQRGLGFGMTTFFAPFDPDKPYEAVSPPKDKATAAQDGLTEWFKQYRTLKTPMIQFYMEAGYEDAPEKEVTRDLLSLREQTGGPNQTDGTKKKLILRFHIYDQQADPHSLATNIFRSADGTLNQGLINTQATNQQIETYLENVKKTNIDQYNKYVEAVRQNKAGEVSAGVDANGNPITLKDTLTNLVVYDTPNGTMVKSELKGGANMRTFKEFLRQLVPTLIPGTNGSLIQTVSVATQTDGAAGAMNVMAARKNEQKGNSSLGQGGLSELSGVPLKAMPMTATMTTLGVPNANLYQTFFIDFGTGISIDNLYAATQITHQISKGKFTTAWTFKYTNGYGRFEAPPALDFIAQKTAEGVVGEAVEAAAAKPGKGSSPKPKAAAAAPG